MKNIIGIIGIGLGVIFATSCSEDNNNGDAAVTNAKVSDKVQEGSWRITYFKDDNVDNTDDYNSYSFSFGSNNVVSAYNGSNIASGTWAVGTDDNDPKLIIGFGFNATFAPLSNDWDVDELQSYKIILSNEISGTTDKDYLTFEKN
jgi:hypothetical protein